MCSMSIRLPRKDLLGGALGLDSSDSCVICDSLVWLVCIVFVPGAQYV